MIEPDPKRVFVLVDAIRPILAGEHPAVQGATIADLLAIWLAGHPKELRRALLAMHVEKALALVPINEGERDATGTGPTFYQSRRRRRGEKSDRVARRKRRDADA